MKKHDITVRASMDRNLTPGTTLIPGGVHICSTVGASGLEMILFPKDGTESLTVQFPEEGRIGQVHTMDLIMRNPAKYLYTLRADGEETADPFAAVYPERTEFGAETVSPKGGFPLRHYDWEGDRRPGTAYEDTIIYRLHVRGFTKHPSAKAGRSGGTFRALIGKIPYLKELGITAVELMPAYEFAERVKKPVSGAPKEGVPQGGEKALEAPGPVNYWGYSPENGYFAPKASYAAGREKNPEKELRDLVKALHREGIELYMEFYFPAGTSRTLVLETVRFWVYEYHIDGVRLTGFADPGILLGDPALTGTKVLAGSFEGTGLPASRRELGRDPGGLQILPAEYNDGFMIDMRCVLKGDENRMGTLSYRLKRNPETFAAVNYMANTNGMTMADMVMYERKHNEANGEMGRDGSEDNYAWNCGTEGPSRKKSISELRARQLRNAFVLLMISQGVPLFLAGDEFGNSQEGNNNAWCQDNPVSWLNWRDLTKNRALHSFVKGMIAFRKEHGVFHQPEEPRNMDYRAAGHPDMSFHGESAWYPQFDGISRELGIFYCGAYGKKPDGSPDDDFYVAVNMHWDPHEFGLPKSARGTGWRVAADTSLPDGGLGRDPSGPDAGELKDQATLTVPPRTIVILQSTEKKAAPAGGRKKAAADKNKQNTEG